MDKKKRSIAVISGEHSGDIYAADLIRGFKKKHSDISFSGISGSDAHHAGLEQWSHCHPKKVMGIWDVLGHLSHYRTLMTRIESQLKARRPDLIVLIDYAELNLRVAQIAHKLKIKVLYYVPPKVWAWRRNRLQKILAFCTSVAPLYPFEYDFFKDHDCPVKLAKHPFIDKIPNDLCAPDDPYVALLPGSRQQEIRSCLPTMLQACQLLLSSHPNLKFKLLCATPTLLPLIERTIRSCECSPPLQIVTEHQTSMLQAARAAIVCSGTAAFECGMLCVPMVVIYRCHWLTYWIAKSLATVSLYSLPNLILNRRAVVELIQSQCQPQNIAEEIDKLLSEGEYRKAQLASLSQMKNQLLQHNDCYAIEDIAFALIQDT